MEDVHKFGKKFHLQSSQDRRKYPRKLCSIDANYMAEGRWYKGSIRNISERGAYISSNRGEKFFPGQDIFIVSRIGVMRKQGRAKIAWVELLG